MSLCKFLQVSHQEEPMRVHEYGIEVERHEKVFGDHGCCLHVNTQADCAIDFFRRRRHHHLPR